MSWCRQTQPVGRKFRRWCLQVAYNHVHTTKLVGNYRRTSFSFTFFFPLYNAGILIICFCTHDEWSYFSFSSNIRNSFSPHKWRKTINSLCRPFTESVNIPTREPMHFHSIFFIRPYLALKFGLPRHAACITITNRQFAKANIWYQSLSHNDAIHSSHMPIPGTDADVTVESEGQSKVIFLQTGTLILVEEKWLHLFSYLA